MYKICLPVILAEVSQTFSTLFLGFFLAFKHVFDKTFLKHTQSATFITKNLKHVLRSC